MIFGILLLILLEHVIPYHEHGLYTILFVLLVHPHALLFQGPVVLYRSTNALISWDDGNG